MPLSLPAIASVPTLPSEDRAEILDTLFEPSTPLHTLSIDLLHTQTFSSYADMICTIGVQLTDLADSSSSSDKEWLDAVLTAHPRLGASKVDSAQSRAEQAQLNATGDQEEAELLRELNERYETTFPGLRYVVFVDGRPRSEILADMQKRIDGSDIMAERTAAIKAMCDIAVDRARKLGV